MSIANPTLEDIWQLFKESDRQLQELRKENDRRFQENERRFQENERWLKEHSQETERLIKEQSQETERLIKEQSQETDRKFQETDKFLKELGKETDRKIQAVSIQIGHLTNRLGEFVEEMVRPAAVRLFKDRGIKVNQVLRNLTAYDAQNNVASEIDLLVINTNIAIVVECKSKLSIDYVNDHLERLDKFKTNFPQYANSTILGSVASMVLPTDVAMYAYRKGLFVLAQSGETIVIRNDAKFQPRQW